MYLIRSSVYKSGTMATADFSQLLCVGCNVIQDVLVGVGFMIKVDGVILTSLENANIFISTYTSSLLLHASLCNAWHTNC